MILFLKSYFTRTYWFGYLSFNRNLNKIYSRRLFNIKLYIREKRKKKKAGEKEESFFKHKLAKVLGSLSSNVLCLISNYKGKFKTPSTKLNRPNLETKRVYRSHL